MLAQAMHFGGAGEFWLYFPVGAAAGPAAEAEVGEEALAFG